MQATDVRPSRVGEAKRWSDCPSCRGEGGFPCGGCEGKRHMSALELKGGPALTGTVDGSWRCADKELVGWAETEFDASEWPLFDSGLLGPVSLKALLTSE